MLGRYTPLLLYAAVYVVTCLIGAVLLLLDVWPFVELFEYFSGTARPELTADQTIQALVLLLVAPLLFIDAYLVAVRLRVWDRLAARRDTSPDERIPRPTLGVIVFAVCFAWAVWNVTRAGLHEELTAWFDYDDWIEARSGSFEQIGFFGFVDIYIFLPLSATWVLLDVAPAAGAPRRQAVLRWLVASIPLALTVLICLALYQKKSAIVCILIALVAVAVHRGWGVTLVQRRRLLVVGVLVVGVVYMATVVAPVVGSTSEPVPIDVGVLNEVPAVAVYAAMAPLTRTSAPALAYPIVYPEKHPYYGLDVGQDVLGFGGAPDDNLVVWEELNPDLEGTSAAPFQFALYSQGGAILALVGSVVLGFLMGVAWMVARQARWPSPLGALAASVVALLAVYLAIESPRNSLIVSYGAMWGFVFVIAAAVAVTAVSRFTARDR